MFERRNVQAIFIASAALVLSSCENSTAPPLVTGLYKMVRYDGHSLPYEIGGSNPKGNSSGGCPVSIAQGRLSIFADAGTFALTYDYQNGCTQELMSQVGVQGKYIADGANLTFIVTRTDGVRIESRGHLTSSTISYENEGLVLLFERR